MKKRHTSRIMLMVSGNYFKVLSTKTTRFPFVSMGGVQLYVVRQPLHYIKKQSTTRATASLVALAILLYFEF